MKYNIENMSDFCEPGNCSELNTSTCEKLFQSENYSFAREYVVYDQDGCFHTNQLRQTPQYETYLKVWLPANIYTLGN